MNLRISSLDPNTPRGDRDCRVCNRRRIKCDRSLPGCKKCAIRNLECTGYERKLKWGQGIASRGKWAGHALPVSLTPTCAQLVQSSSSQLRETSVGVMELSRPALKPREAPGESRVVFRRGVGQGRGRHQSKITELIKEEGGRKFSFSNQFGIDLCLSWSRLPEVFQHPQARRLIHHFDQHVAVTLVWVDGTENPWRNIILPLAMESPPLLFAMLALAAEHFSSQMRRNGLGSSPTSISSHGYRDRSLELVTQKLRSEAYDTSVGYILPEPASVKTLLATMLVLCNLEMVPSDSKVWSLHLQASRTMIQRWLFASPSIDLSDAISEFLLAEFFVLDVLASTSSFGNDQELLRMKPKEAEFSEFLQVIHDVTIAERRRQANLDIGVPSHQVDMLLLHRRFEHARACTRRFSRTLGLQSELVCGDFDRVVEIYHRAGLIYTYQALAEPEVAAETIRDLLENLIEDLKLMPAKGILAQDLAWPLFIAGTASRGREPEQQVVERLLLETMQATGFSNSQQALQFLRLFWAAESVEGDNWLRFARANEETSYVFLAT